MTDIWRSFVAQACLWPCGWRLAYRGPSMVQERNPHNLLRDFEAEVPGYLQNAAIVERLGTLDMEPGPKGIRANMRRCYETLVAIQLVDAIELKLLDLWFEDRSGTDERRGVKSALVIPFNQDFTQNVPKLDTHSIGALFRDSLPGTGPLSRLGSMHHEGGLRGQAAHLADRVVSATRRRLGKHNSFELRGAEAVTYEDQIFHVVGHQFYFYHFAVQAADALLKLNVDWFWLIGDDAILNSRLDEATLARRFDLDARTDAVLCRPVYGSDAWIEHICGSVDSGLQRASSALGRDGHGSRGG